MRSWSIKDSAELYQTANWGAGFFGINEKGHVQVTPRGPEGAAVDLYELLPSLQARGLRLPLLVRFSDIVSSRVRGLAVDLRARPVEAPQLLDEGLPADDGVRPLPERPLIARHDTLERTACSNEEVALRPFAPFELRVERALEEAQLMLGLSADDAAAVLREAPKGRRRRRRR